MRISKLFRFCSLQLLLILILCGNIKSQKIEKLDLYDVYNFQNLINNSSGYFNCKDGILKIRIVIRNFTQTKIFIPISSWSYVDLTNRKHYFFNHTGELFLTNRIFGNFDLKKMFGLEPDDYLDIPRHQFINEINYFDSLTINLQIRNDSIINYKKNDSLTWFFSCTNYSFINEASKLANIDFMKLLHNYDSSKTINLIFKDNSPNFLSEFRKKLKKKESDFLRFIFRNRYKLVLRYSENL